MTNWKLLRYAVASQRIEEVSREERWGQGAGMSYQYELASDRRNYAKSRSGYDEIKGCAIGGLTSIVSAVSAGTLGAVFVANGDDTGTMAKITYKALAGVGSFIGGGILGLSPHLIKSSLDYKFINNVIKKRSQRRIDRKIHGISESQRRSAHLGLVSSEWDRADMMTGKKVPKPPILKNGIWRDE